MEQLNLLTFADDEDAAVMAEQEAKVKAELEAKKNAKKPPAPPKPANKPATQPQQRGDKFEPNANSVILLWGTSRPITDFLTVEELTHGIVESTDENGLEKRRPVTDEDLRARMETEFAEFTKDLTEMVFNKEKNTVTPVMAARKKGWEPVFHLREIIFAESTGKIEALENLKAFLATQPVGPLCSRLRFMIQEQYKYPSLSALFAHMNKEIHAYEKAMREGVA